MDHLKNVNWIGKVCFFEAETESTNDLLHKLVKEKKVPSGAVLYTDYQSRGKGQRGSTWLGNKGENIAMSIYLNELQLSHNQSFKLNQIVSLSVVEALSNELDKSVLIKWPNDIYYKNKKLGGILIELSSQGSIVFDAILGIGININQIIFPKGLLNPSSLRLIDGINRNRKYIMEAICRRLEHWYTVMMNDTEESLHGAYLNKLLGYGEERYFEIGGIKTKATLLGIGERGLLKLAVEGNIRFFDLKEVRFVF